jgi:hypothetical protein
MVQLSVLLAGCVSVLLAGLKRLQLGGEQLLLVEEPHDLLFFPFLRVLCIPDNVCACVSVCVCVCDRGVAGWSICGWGEAGGRARGARVFMCYGLPFGDA